MSKDFDSRIFSGQFGNHFNIGEQQADFSQNSQVGMRKSFLSGPLMPGAERRITRR